jgi:hypothetical protein
MNCRIDGPVFDLCACRVFAEEVVAFPVLRWPDRPWYEPAAAVWADITQGTLDASCAKGAFITANARFE